MVRADHHVHRPAETDPGDRYLEPPERLAVRLNLQVAALRIRHEVERQGPFGVAHAAHPHHVSAGPADGIAEQEVDLPLVFERVPEVRAANPVSRE